MKISKTIYFCLFVAAGIELAFFGSNQAEARGGIFGGGANMPESRPADATDVLDAIENAVTVMPWRLKGLQHEFLWERHVGLKSTDTSGAEINRLLFDLEGQPDIVASYKNLRLDIRESQPCIDPVTKRPSDASYFKGVVCFSISHILGWDPNNAPKSGAGSTARNRGPNVGDLGLRIYRVLAHELIHWRQDLAKQRSSSEFNEWQAQYFAGLNRERSVFLNEVIAYAEKEELVLKKSEFLNQSLLKYLNDTKPDRYDSMVICRALDALVSSRDQSDGDSGLHGVMLFSRDVHYLFNISALRTLLLPFYCAQTLEKGDGRASHREQMLAAFRTGDGSFVDSMAASRSWWDLARG